jgi:hypothetical protein
VALTRIAGRGRIQPTTDGVAQEAEDAARLIAASYEYHASPHSLQAAVDKHVPPGLAAKYGRVDSELSNRSVLVFANESSGEVTMAYRGTVTASE